MRIIFGIGSRLFVWETSVSKVAMRIAGSSEENDNDEFEPAPPQDPHGTLNCHAELSPSVVYDSAKAGKRFGFHGS